MAGAVGERLPVQDSAREHEAREVRPRDVPVPVGRHPHGACPQLHDRRCVRALPAYERLRRLAPHRVGRLRPTGRERRHQAQHAARQVDVQEHRDPKGQLQAHGPFLRLGPHRHHLQGGLLPLGPVVLPQDVREGPRLPQEQPGQLVPELQDRARQRASRAGHVLALPQRRRAQGARPVVPQDNRLRPGAPRRPRPARRLARARQADAGQLDRPFRGRARRLHAVRRAR